MVGGDVVYLSGMTCSGKHSAAEGSKQLLKINQHLPTNQSPGNSLPKVFLKCYYANTSYSARGHEKLLGVRVSIRGLLWLFDVCKCQHK